MIVSRRAIAVSTIVSAVAIVALVLITRPQPGSITEDGPQGTLAFTRLLAGLELGGDRGDPPPGGGTFLLFRDVRGEPETADLLAWVREGGRLVVTDPTSPIYDAFGVTATGRMSGAVFGTRTVRPDCPEVEELVGLNDAEVRADDRALRSGDDPATTLCLRTTTDAGWLVHRRVGDGVVLMTGGRSPFTNELLREGDNAALVIRLVGGTGAGPVVQGGPVPIGDATSTSVWRAMPPRVRVSLWGAMLAAVVYGLVRGRRLGWHPDEQLPSPIPASALISATAELYRSSGDRDHVAGLLREHTRRELGRRVGLAPSDPTELLVGAVAAATDLPPEEVRARLDGRRPDSDEALVRLGRDLDDLRTRIGGTT